jgi:hypothetical protein
MVSSCINPACHTELKLLRSGDLYALERRSANTEFFWLCAACVPVVSLFLDLTGSVSVGHKFLTRLRQRPDPKTRLTLVYSPLERTPWLRASFARGLSFSERRSAEPLSLSREAA